MRAGTLCFVNRIYLFFEIVLLISLLLNFNQKHPFKFFKKIQAKSLIKRGMNVIKK